MTHTESIFIDSGAWTLYAQNILQAKKREGKHGRQLERPKVRWGSGDFSFFNLKRGSDFRTYLDAYADFIYEYRQYRKLLFATVDVISNPDLTWDIQKHFEEEYGLTPIPIVHYGATMEQVDRYLESGRYKLLGVGGFSQDVPEEQYFRWCDRLFVHLCPESNGHKPVVRTHGFAATSWEWITRWPWWSVDSTSWVKYSAYGWLCFPRWSEKRGCWDFDRKPFIVNMSHRSPQKKLPWKHFDNAKESTREVMRRWIAECGMEMGKVDDHGEEVERGVTTHHSARSICNLHFFKKLEQSRPGWPHSLSDHVEDTPVHYHKGFGLQDASALPAELVPVRPKYPERFRIFFSGASGLTDTPEALIPQLNPHIMLTYWNIFAKQESTLCRLDAFLKQHTL